MFRVIPALDPGSISAWYRTIVSSYRSPSSWWYSDFLDHSVQDVPPPSLSRTWIFHRSPRWRRSQAYRLPAHDQVLSYVRVDILEMANIVLGYPHVVVSQSCANGILCRFRHTSFPVLEFAFTSLSATLENSMLCSHSSLWLQVFLYYLRSKFEFFASSPWAARCTRTQRCLETDRQSSTLNSTWVLISQPFVHLLLVFLAAFAFSTRSERSWSSWNGLMQTVKFPWCWTNGEGGSTLHGWNCPFVRMSASWFLVSTNLIWIWDPSWLCQIAQSSATLWERDTCLMIGLLPCTIIYLDCCFAVINNAKQSAEVRKFASVTTWSTLINLRSSRLKCFFVLVLVRFLDCSLSHKFPWKQSWFKEECNPSVTQIPEIKSGNTIHAPTCKVKKQLQIQWNRERLKFVSYTSNL